ncbi:MAG: DUF2339 domain-containing protein [Thermoguttaceae bacterium]
MAIILLQFLFACIVFLWILAPFVSIGIAIFLFFRFNSIRDEFENLRDDFHFLKNAQQHNKKDLHFDEKREVAKEMSQKAFVESLIPGTPISELVIESVTKLETETKTEIESEIKPEIEIADESAIKIFAKPATETTSAKINPEIVSNMQTKSAVKKGDSFSNKIGKKNELLPSRSEVSALELLIGRKIILWAAMILFVLVAAFFVKYAVDNNWVSDTLKVASIGIFGGIFIAAGKYFSHSGLRRLSIAMNSAGISIVFLAGYVSYNYFDLIPIKYASVMMIMIVIGGFLLSSYYRSRLLGIVSVFGGLSVPMLVPSEVDRYLEFFSYLAALNLGSVVLLNVMKRAPIGCVAFFGTQIEFWMWHSRFYEPEKLAAVIGFQIILYLIYLIDTGIAALRPNQKTTWDDAVRAVLSPIVLAQCVSYFLWHDEFFRDWIGIFAFAFSAFYAILAVLFTQHLRRIFDKEIAAQYSIYWLAGPVAAVIIAVMFVTVGIPLQFHARWISLGWYVLTSCLWFAGFRFRQKAFVVLAGIIHVLAFGWYITHDIPIQISGEFSAEILSTSLLPSLLISAFLIGTSIITKQWIRDDFATEKGANTKQMLQRKNADETNSALNSLRGLEGVVIAWMILSFAMWHYFIEHPISFWESNSVASPEFVAHSMLAVLWTLFASIIFGVGFVVHSANIRKLAVAGYVLVCAKIAFLQLFLRVPMESFHRANEWAFGYNEPSGFESWQFFLWNPWFVNTVIPLLVMLILAALLKWPAFKERLDQTDTKSLKILGFNALVILWILLTIECFICAHSFTVLSARFLAIDWTALALITLLWSLYGTILMGIGIAARSRAIRTFACVVFVITGLKILLPDMICSSASTQVLWNAYFVPTILFILAIFIFTIWANRLSKQTDIYEKRTFTSLGIFATVLLWIAASSECFHYFNLQIDWPHHLYIGLCSVTIFSTLFALILVFVGLKREIMPIRCLGYSILILTVLKACSMELVQRPHDLYPFLNIFSLSFFSLSFTVILVSLLVLASLPPHRRIERILICLFGFGGLALLWICSSLECYDSVVVLSETKSESVRQAQMAVSILWSIFAGILIAVGFVFHSAVLRWFSITLFGITTMKVVVVDMQGLDQLYRIGAFFVLAVALFLAAWTYQRFRDN